MSSENLEFDLEGEDHITLQALLKVSGLCESGGDAKVAINAGKVKVDGAVETRRGHKIHIGQSVSFEGKVIKVN